MGDEAPSTEYAGLVSPRPELGLRKEPLREKMLCLRSPDGLKPHWKKDPERDLIEPGVSGPGELGSRWELPASESARRTGALTGVATEG